MILKADYGNYVIIFFILQKEKSLLYLWIDNKRKKSHN